MRRSRWTTWLLGLSLAVVPVHADDEVDLLIAYILAALKSPQTACAQSLREEYAGQRVVCGTYDDSFSALKSDWELIMRHTRLPIPISTEDAWTYRDGGFRVTYRHGGDRELQVAFYPQHETLQFAYTEKEVDAYAGDGGPANDRPLGGGAERPPRVAGFAGVTVPRVIEASRVEPLRSLRAQAERVAGTVTLEVVVQKDGRVRDVTALSATPAGYDFDVAALEAVRQWRFEPALFENAPVDAVLNLKVEVKEDPPPPGDDEDVE